MKQFAKCLLVSWLWLGAAMAATNIAFNGTSTRVDMGSGNFPGISDLTIEAWVKSPSLAELNTYGSIAGQSYLGVGNNGFGLLMDKANGSVNFQLRYNNSAYQAKAPFPFDNEWHHVAGVRDGTALKVYLDGILVDSVVAPVGAVSATVNFALGARHDGGSSWGYYFKGSMADIRLWDCARSGAEVLASALQRLQGNEPGLIGYWPLNDGSGGSLAADLSAGIHHGTITGGTWSYDVALSALYGYKYFNTWPLMMANPVTGSTRFTNSNGVEIAAFPFPTAYTSYQLSHAAAPDTLAGNGWVAVATPLAAYDFTTPVADTNITFYTWFTNDTTAVVLRRARCDFIYSTALPLPKAHGVVQRALASDGFASLTVDEVDAGTLGGIAGGSVTLEALSLHSRALHLLSGPDVDAAPADPLQVKVGQPGEYEVGLIAVNEAGNVVTAGCTLVIAPWSEVVFPKGPGGVGVIATGSDLRLWLKADAGAEKDDGDGGYAAAVDGEAVKRWRDQSGWGNDGSQSASERRPILVADSFNAMPAIRFGPSTLYHHIDFGNFADFYELTVFDVGFLASDAPASATAVFGVGDAGKTGNFLIRWHGSNNKYWVSGRGAGDASYQYINIEPVRVPHFGCNTLQGGDGQGVLPWSALAERLCGGSCAGKI